MSEITTLVNNASSGAPDVEWITHPQTRIVEEVVGGGGGGDVVVVDLRDFVHHYHLFAFSYPIPVLFLCWWMEIFGSGGSADRFLYL